jgi:hypothetical protein
MNSQEFDLLAGHKSYQDFLRERVKRKDFPYSYETLEQMAKLADSVKEYRDKLNRLRLALDEIVFLEKQFAMYDKSRDIAMDALKETK